MSVEVPHKKVYFSGVLIRPNHALTESGMRIYDIGLWGLQQAATYLQGARLTHTMGVRKEAYYVSEMLGLTGRMRDLVLGSASLHDLGYGLPITSFSKTTLQEVGAEYLLPELGGMHQLGGAEFTLKRTRDWKLASLVAHHSEARIEAEIRGQEWVTRLNKFPYPRGNLLKALKILTYCDETRNSKLISHTTGPEKVTIDERFSDIRTRRRDDFIVQEWLSRAEVPIRMMVSEVEQMLDELTGYYVVYAKKR